MATLNRDTLPVPDALARAMDLTPEAVLAVLGSQDAPTGYATALPAVEPDAMLALWQQALERTSATGYRPVLYEPRREPGARDELQEEPQVLEPPGGMSPAPTSTELRGESASPVYRSAEEVLQAASGNDIEDTLLSPRDAVDPDTLTELSVPAEDLVQLPTGPTSRVDASTGVDDDRVLESPDVLMVLVRAGDPGEALARLYLGADVRAGSDLARMLGILRSWHRRFGAEVLQVKAEAAVLELWVPHPPEGRADRYRLGEEAKSFWPPSTAAWGDDPRQIGAALGGSRVWRFHA